MAQIYEGETNPVTMMVKPKATLTTDRAMMRSRGFPATIAFAFRTLSQFPVLVDALVRDCLVQECVWDFQRR